MLPKSHATPRAHLPIALLVLLVPLALASCDGGAGADQLLAPGERSASSVTVDALELEIVPAAASVSAGEPAVVVVTVTNTASAAADSVGLEVNGPTLPSNVDSSGWSTGGADDGCTNIDWTIGCFLNALPAGATAQVELSYPTTLDACQDTDPQVVVSAHVQLAMSSRISADALVGIDCPSLVLEVSPDSAAVSAGETGTATVTVTNTGEGAAFDVGVRVNGSTTLGLDDSGWSTGGATDQCATDLSGLECYLEALPAGGSATLFLDIPTEPEACDAADPKEALFAEFVGPHDQGVQVVRSVLSIHCPSLQVDIQPDAPGVSAGRSTGVTMTVTNNGEGTAFDAVLAFDVFVSLYADSFEDLDDSGWSTGGSMDGCDAYLSQCYLEALASGASATIRFTILTSLSLCDSVDPDPIHITATATASTDSYSSPQAEDRQINLLCPRLTTEITTAASPILAGDSMHATLTVRNEGDGDALKAVLISSGGTSESGRAFAVDTTGWSNGGATDQCYLGMWEVQCVIDVLPAGTSASYDVAFETRLDDCSANDPRAYVIASFAHGDFDDHYIHVTGDSEAVVDLACAPTASAGGPYSGEEGGPISFDGTASTDPAGAGLDYHWTFGDGVTATGPAPSHTYADDGSYTVTLTVTDDNGATATAQSTADVVNVAPAVDAGPDISVWLGQPADLAATFTDPGDDAPWSWAVDWGDGTVSTGDVATAGSVAASHTFPSTGTFTVTVAVDDGDGGLGQDQLVVEVTALEVPMDVKPGSDGNPVNGRGVLPVALLSGPIDGHDFDATTIDVATLRFGPGSAGEAHGRLHSEDVDGDGDLDAVLHFQIPASGIRCDDGQVTLEAMTHAGVPIRASDSIRCPGKGRR